MSLDDIYLQELSLYDDKPDSEIDLGALALALIAPDHKGISLDRYVRHLDKIKIEVGVRYNALITSGAGDDAQVRLAALKYVLIDIYDYRLDDPNHEILEGADIMRIIDRARGCRVGLCVLYMIAARAQGWNIQGLNFPSRFLCRIEQEGERIIFDPAVQCKVLEAHDLRVIVKDTLSEEAELSTEYYEGVDGRGSIIHLFNFIKIRRIEMGEYKAALDIVLRLRCVASGEYRLLLDAGVLHARLGENQKAIDALNEYIECAPDCYDREEARLLLGELLVYS